MTTQQQNIQEPNIAHKAPDTEKDPYQAIAENICRQLIEFQNHIAAREPGMRFPDAKEVETMRKLIACLDKIKKIGAPPVPARVAKGRDNPDYITNDSNPVKATNTITQSPRPLRTHSGASLEKTLPRRNQPVISSAAEQSDEAPAVTLEDFDKYGKIVWNGAVEVNDVAWFKGKNVSSKWLQYNLFQWCRLPHEREFINSEKEYESLVDYKVTVAQINGYLAVYGRRAPSKAA